MTTRMCWRVGWVLALGALASPSWSLAAKRPAKTSPPEAERSQSAREAAPASAEPAAIELFEAIDAGQIEAKFIPKNSEKGRLFLKNKTGRPLSVRLPPAFAGVPVLAQFQFPGGAAPGGNNAGWPLGNAMAQSAGASQTVGAGVNGGRNNRGGPFGVFNVAADKTLELKVPCVCLEHGKPTPRPAIPYRLVKLESVKIESVNADPALQAVLAGLGENRYSQRVAQAAAWRLANRMSWEQLAAERIEHLIGPSVRYFSAKELAEARELVEEASAAEPATPSPGESLTQR